MIALCILGTLLIQWGVFRRRPLHDPIWSLFLIYLYYAFFVPVAMVLSGDYAILLVNEPIWVNDGDLDLSLLIGLLGYAGMALGYWVITRDVIPPAPKGDESLADFFQRSVTLKVLLVLIAVFAGVVLVLFREDLFAVLQGYETKIETNYESSSFAYFTGAVLILISIAANYTAMTVRTGLPVAAMAGLFFVVVSFLVFSKQPFIFAYVAAVCYLARFRNISPFALTTALAFVAVLILIYLVPVFAAYRGTGEIDMEIAGQASSAVIASDALGPYGVTIYAINGYVHVNDHPFWQSYTLWIPRFFWPDRPLDLPEDFARQIIVGWRPGLGLGFSPLAEAYARVGTLGTGFFMAICGATLGLIPRLATRLFPTDARAAVMLTLGGALSISAMRGAYSSIITQGIQYAVPLVATGAIVWEFNRRSQLRSQAKSSRRPGSVGKPARS